MRTSETFPHVQFDQWELLSRLHKKWLASGGVLMNLIVAVSILILSVVPLSINPWILLNETAYVFTAIENGCKYLFNNMDAQEPWVNFSHLFFSWILVCNLFSIICNLLPISRKSDGWQIFCA